jgi:NAD(P)-dependent dehydrogenase (short-subunit alcohol dehydrogenase family)
MDAGQSRGLPQHRLDEYCRQNPLGRLLLPEEVAEVALQLIGSGDRLMSGARIPVDGGI